ncbi:MAG: VTT domain-containing protein [Usitatibacter sp.]
MFDWSGDTGLAALFAASFLSATVLPANSELVLVAVLKAAPESAALAIAIATIGNTLGGLTTYGLGRLVPTRRLPSPRIVAAVQRYGALSLLFSWVPLVGDALCAAAGWLRVPLWAATLGMFVGKLLRYLVVARIAASF